MDKLAKFVGYQPYLHAKPDAEDSLNSLEKLKQVGGEGREDGEGGGL